MQLQSGCNGRQGASANGPAWAAPRKHRTRIRDSERSGVQFPYVCGLGCIPCWLGKGA
jgi:hypothetical protein